MDDIEEVCKHHCKRKPEVAEPVLFVTAVFFKKIAQYAEGTHVIIELFEIERRYDAVAALGLIIKAFIDDNDPVRTGKQA